MPTSELSNALNPHVIQTRQRTSSSSYATHLRPVVQPPQVYTPHRSELELAISEPPPPPPRTRTKPSSEGIHAVQELLRVLSSSKEAQENERKRRLAWEQEQEAKYTQRQAEMEKELFEMRQQLAFLQNVAVTPPTLAVLQTSQCDLSVPSHLHPQFSSFPISPVSQTPSFHDLSPESLIPPPIVQHPYHENALYQWPQEEQTYVMTTELPSPAPSPSPSPASVDPSSSRIKVSARRRKQTSDQSSGEDHSDSESSGSLSNRRVKRINHHDTRCLTIHQAMRLHIIHLMQVERGSLPDGHTEGAPLGPDDPIRFVWDKTPKQSVHNSHMKARVIADLKSNRRLYKHVPDKDFSKKTLDSVFDQAFVTFRQKFKTQRDASAASNLKKREDVKALKARRLSRKKIKLSNRAEARMRLEAFESTIFDGALQIECMSSEESDNDDVLVEGSSSGVLRSRGLPWRSSRLQKFYGTLDEEERLGKSQKPKRGIGKKTRLRGPNKEGFYLPPKGVANWMVSKRWITASQKKYPDLLDMLRKLIVDPPDLDQDRLRALEEESCNEL